MSERPASLHAERRSLLVSLFKLLWLAPLTLAISQIARYLRFALPTGEQSRYAVVKLADLPVLPAYLEKARAWLFRDAAGFYALDAICTHLGCVAHLTGQQEFQCACHGSRFGVDGRVLNGPAQHPLRYIGLYWREDGQLVVDRAWEVDATFRLPSA